MAACAVTAVALTAGSRRPFELVRSGDSEAAGLAEAAAPEDVIVEDTLVDGDAAEAGARSPDEGAGKEGLATVIVHVDGAVASPGVYRIQGRDLRLIDAVTRAGGLLPEADTQTLNLAAPLADGMKVHVPVAGEVVEATAPQYDAGGDAAASELVNINTATMEELMALPGVGEATARSIVEDRTNNGPFTSPEDIMRVSGIGEKKFARMRDEICV